jgi:hypothetical protein
MAVALGIRGIANSISGIAARRVAGAYMHELLTPYITQERSRAIAAVDECGPAACLRLDYSA